MRIRMGKKKRAVSLLLIAGMLCALVVPLAPPASAEGLDVPAPAAVLMEFSTGEVLYEKNPHEIRPCASITKVMTLLLVFEAIDSGALHYDDMLTASAHAAGMGGSDIWLKEGEQMTVDDLIKACVVMSANDAAGRARRSRRRHGGGVRRAHECARGGARHERYGVQELQRPRRGRSRHERLR